MNFDFFFQQNIEPCCLSKERALAAVDDCGCSTRCGKCHVPEGFPCDPSIDVCQTGTKCVLNPSSNDTTLGIGQQVFQGVCTLLQGAVLEEALLCNECTPPRTARTSGLKS